MQVKETNLSGVLKVTLDAFEDEPLDPSSALLDLGYKVLLSPHTVSDNIGAGLGPGIDWASKAILSALGGTIPDNVYNPEVIPRWREHFEDKSLFAQSPSTEFAVLGGTS